MFKLMMYVCVLVEVTEGNKKFLSRIPWGLYFYYQLNRRLAPEKYNDFSIRLVMPWQHIVNNNA